MDNKTYNSLIASLIAICIYILLILFIFLYLQKPIVKNYTSISKNTVIQLDIIIQKDKVLDKKIKEVKKRYSQTVDDSKHSSSVSALKKTDLKSLFSKVSTNSDLVQKDKVLNLQKNENVSRFKSSFSKNKKQIKLKDFDDIKDIKKTQEIDVTNKGEFDEYFSKVSSFILTKWYNQPLFTQDKYSVKVNIHIDVDGRFSYTIMSYSGNLNVDSAIDTFLKEQLNVVYPIPIDGKSKDILINFIDAKV